MNALHLVASNSARSPGDNWSEPAEIDDRCLILFDRWCERRCVLPLMYLMHSWPMPTRNLRAVQRLSETLRDLEMFHAETLIAEERLLLSELVELTTQALHTSTKGGRGIYD